MPCAPLSPPSYLACWLSCIAAAAAAASGRPVYDRMPVCLPTGVYRCKPSYADEVSKGVGRLLMLRGNRADSSATYLHVGLTPRVSGHQPSIQSPVPQSSPQSSGAQCFSRPAYVRTTPGTWTSGLLRLLLLVNTTAAAAATSSAGADGSIGLEYCGLLGY